MTKVTITMEEEQANILMEALDFYSRWLEGQFGEGENLFRRYIGPYAIWPSRPHGLDIFPDYRMLGKLLELARDAAMPQLERGAYIGIYEAPKVARIAYDMRTKIEHDLSWYHQPGGDIGVKFDEPMHLVKELPLPEVRIE